MLCQCLTLNRFWLIRVAVSSICMFWRFKVSSQIKNERFTNMWINIAINNADYILWNYYNSSLKDEEKKNCCIWKRNRGRAVSISIANVKCNHLLMYATVALFSKNNYNYTLSFFADVRNVSFEEPNFFSIFNRSERLNFFTLFLWYTSTLCSQVNNVIKYSNY